MININAQRLFMPASDEPPSPPLFSWARALRRRRRRPDRRGVLLLLMLCLLVLFAVLGVTYVLVASQFRRSTAAQPRLEQYAPDYRSQLDDAAMILFRGSTNPRSMIQDSSLLEDMYGTDAFKGKLSRAAVGSAHQTTSPDQLLDLTFGGPFYLAGSTITSTTGLSVIPGYYNGCVLTMTSGALAGLSTRIVGYNPNLRAGSVGPPMNPIVRVMPFEGRSAMPQSGDWFLVNGRPFNGTGAGYNSLDGLPDMGDPNFALTPPPSLPAPQSPLLALMPNPRPEFSGSGDYYLTYLASSATTPPLNDEDYDAPDFNNMHLAFMPSNPTSSSQILPSFHRPELLSYWANYPAAGAVTPGDWTTLPHAKPAPPTIAPKQNFRSQIMLRPIGPTSGGSLMNPSGSVVNPDHPNFTGSNPSFCADLNANSTDATGTVNPGKYSWDVDNDGDGIADSVWIDLGLPVQTSADGTAYKPLVAFLCLDLDGRLNVNAHGNPAQTEGDYAAAQPNTATSAYFAPNPNLSTATSSQTQLIPDTGVTAQPIGITQGLGYGPADINLGAPTNTGVMPAGSPANTLFKSTTEYAGLMQGNIGTGGQWNGASFEGRYGETTAPVAAAAAYPPNAYQGWPYWAAGSVSAPKHPYAGATLSTYGSNGTTGTTSFLGYIKQFETQLFPNSAATGLAVTSLGSPIDLVGRGFIGLDVRGTPLTPGMGSPQDMLNNPYLLDLSRKAQRGALPNGAVDNPFAPAELERVLRTYDSDVTSLPARLAALLNPTNSNPQSFRTLVTTDSYDLPSPNFGYTVDLRNIAQGPNAAANGIPLVSSTVVDLLVARLGGVGATQLTDPNFTSIRTGWNTIPKQVQIMLSPDLLAGKRMDINRALGNGRDDNNDGVVDDLLEVGGSTYWTALPAASVTAEQAWNANDVSPAGPLNPTNVGTKFSAPGTTLQSQFDHANGMDINLDGAVNATGPNPTDELLARQLLARQLYVLAMMLVDQSALQLSPTSPAPAGKPMFLYDTNTNNKYQMQYALAQWAVNCVDFRDRDSVMTPFEFDIFPFDGWTIDGVLDDGTGNVSKDDTSSERGLVWGSERPELLITETLAWHDRRTEDLTTPSGKTTDPPPTDPNFDQRLAPHDRLFIELYNPWNTDSSTANPPNYSPSPTEVPGEFYFDARITPPVTVASGVPGGVLLNKTDTATGTSPVWRMIFVKDGNQLLDPDDPTGAFPAGAATPVTSIERIVYFTKSGAVSKYPKAVGTTGVTYFSNQFQSSLLPGRYAVIGSSAESLNGTTGPFVSRIGMDNTSASAPTDTTSDVPGTRRIVLTPLANAPNTPQVSMNLNTQPADGSWPLPAEPAPLNGAGGHAAHPAVGIVIDTAVIGAGVAGTRSLGISDPPFGNNAAKSAYPTPTVPLNALIDTTFAGSITDSAYNPVIDTPFDDPTAGYTGSWNGTPLSTNGVIPSYATCFLQRLANPQLPWNPLKTDPNYGAQNNSAYPINPYLTIDSMSIDLACFNGTTTTTDPKAGGAYSAQFRSTQRGDQYLNSAGTLTTTGTVLPPFSVANSLLWAHEPPHVAAQTAGATSTFVAGQVFKFGLQHSLGYINPAYSYNSTSAATKTPWFAGTGSSNPPPGNNTNYTGTLDPSQKSSTLGPIPPFPWLTWNNRPYVSPMELALVPKTRSSQLLSTYTPAGSANPNYYTYTQPRPGNILSYPFGHLLDFFRGGTGDKATQSGVAGFDAPQLFRIFDFLQVPSPFVNTETELDPTWCDSTYATNATDNTGVKEANFGAYFHLPFNRVSNYRDPGRVNVNTISDPAVWNAITNGTQMPPWGGVVSSRRGYEAAASTYTTNSLLPSPASPYTMGPWPTYFGNPFRSAAGAAYTNSQVTAAVSAAMPTTGSPTGLLPRADIDVTLLRPFHPETEGLAGALFDFPQTQGATVNQTTGMYNDATRSPYFKMQNVSRMSNLLTTRSNVYAVWITVGYFQVTPWYGTTPVPPTIVYDAAHPDGYQLGQELGNDSGQIKRHRAFYLFDRTIPVGFERGADHNVQNAILLRRFIE